MSDNETMTKGVIAVDLGASSGRLIYAGMSGKTIRMDEIYRFPNTGITTGDRIYTDILHIYQEILTGLNLAWKKYRRIDAVGVDSWGVDFGLIDTEAELKGNPFHYRDPQARGMKEEAEALFGADGLFRRTGVQDMWYNTSFQFLGLQKRKPGFIKSSDRFLLIADLIGYLLTGRMSLEYTGASTTQLLDVKNGGFSREILDRLGIPPSVFPGVRMTGSVKGYLKPEICTLAGIPSDASIPVIHTAQHDSASAAYAVPAKEEPYLFINSGTWSIIGTILDQPVISDETCRELYSNEGAAFGKFKLVKSIMGMWLIQELRKSWDRQGLNTGYAYLTEAARQAKPFSHVVHVDDELFAAPADMADAFRAYFAKTGQAPTEDQGVLYRTVIESLAFQYRKAVDDLEKILRKKTDTIYFLGGAVRDSLFCQFIANATGKAIMAGPVEATAAGNALVQLKALGAYESREEKTEILKNSFNLTSYTPDQDVTWDAEYQKYLKMLRGDAGFMGM